MPTSYRTAIAEIIAATIVVLAERALRSLCQPEPDSPVLLPPPPPVVLTTTTERSP
ncbi:MAG: hypothetical protein WCJ64_27485 [Rhodospirillaceae bacterium]